MLQTYTIDQKMKVEGREEAIKRNYTHLANRLTCYIF